MRLQIRGLESKERVSDGVAARESVVRKLLHQREDLFSLLFLDSPLDRAFNKLLLMLRHLFALLLTHGSAHQVGFAECVAGQPLRELHDLFLVDEYAEGVAENVLHLWHQVPDSLLSPMPLNKLFDHAAIQWPRPVKRI